MFKNDGNEDFMQKNFSNAIYLYTEGIKVNCKDKELNAKLYSNRATAHFYLGKNICIFYRFRKLKDYFKMNLFST